MSESMPPGALETVRELARSLNLVDHRGNLVALDSLMMIELLVALEERLGVEVDVTDLGPTTFQSLDSIAQLVARRNVA